MRILITGASGFIGGRLGQYLHQNGHEVKLASRFINQPPPWLQEARCAPIEWNKYKSLQAACENIDIVIHAAGMNAKDCTADPVSALQVNGINTASLVQAAISRSVSKFIYLSTAHVYASSLEGAILEATCPQNLHPYATSHLAGEKVVLAASQRGEIKGIVVRLSNSFGAPVHLDVNCWMLVINDLCRQAIVDNKLVIRSSGLQHRDFISVNEVCRSLEFLFTQRLINGADEIYNIGSGVSTTVLEMAKLIQKRCKDVLGIDPEIKTTSAADGSQFKSLTYSNLKLKNVGFNIDSNNEPEIDELLIFCKKWFSKSNVNLK